MRHTKRMGKPGTADKVNASFTCQRCGFLYPRKDYVPDQNIKELRTCRECADTYNAWVFSQPLAPDTSYLQPWYSPRPPIVVPPGTEDPVWPPPTTP